MIEGFFAVASMFESRLRMPLAIAAFGAIVGFWIAYWLDAPTSASMAIWYGVMFLATLVISGGVRRRGARSGVGAAIHQRHPHRIGSGTTQGN